MRTSATLKQARRSKSGAATGLVVALAFVLIIVIVAAIKLSMTLSSSQAVRNSVDAAALNIATHVPDMKSPPGSEMYKDCVDITGKIGLTNINRVWGKALLISANAAEMQNSGQAGSAEGGASKAMDAAKDVNGKLHDVVSNADGLGAYVDPGKSGATEKPAAASKTGGSDQSQAPQFDSAYVHKGDESNISINPAQLPDGIKLDVEPVDTGDGKYLAGYKPIKINGKDFMFVPFRRHEMPHLISREEFLANKSIPAQAPSGLAPNAFFAAGKLGGGSTVASASAVANPQHTYELAIPCAYVWIKLEPTKTTWLVNNKEVNTSTYEFQPTEQWKVESYKVGCDYINGYATLGKEFGSSSPSLYKVITAFGGTYDPIFQKMKQRLSEVDPGFSKDQLLSLLKSQPVTPGVYDYVIYPKYATLDHTHPSITIAAKNDVTEPWFVAAPPEGTESTLTEDYGKDEPNSNRAQIVGIWILGEHHVEVRGKLKWTPGTGAAQNLGMLKVERQAKVTFEGTCPPN